MKIARFHSRARETIQSFSEEVRRKLGMAIFDLQKGRPIGMPLSRTMPSVAKGVEELRVKDRNGAYRVFYLARLKDEVLIVHAFTKKTEKTPAIEIETAKRRLKELLDEGE
jgi:phage-related protein